LKPKNWRLLASGMETVKISDRSAPLPGTGLERLDPYFIQLVRARPLLLCREGPGLKIISPGSRHGEPLGRRRRSAGTGAGRMSCRR
jgi:hypothetical protein